MSDVAKKNSFAHKVTEDYAVCRGVNFEAIIIGGKQAKLAAEWIERTLYDEISDVNEV